MDIQNIYVKTHIILPIYVVSRRSGLTLITSTSTAASGELLLLHVVLGRYTATATLVPKHVRRLLLLLVLPHVVLIAVVCAPRSHNHSRHL